MKRNARSLPLAALAASTVSAQSSSILVNDPNDPLQSTVFVSACPSDVTTTITLPTQTFCPGPHCSGGGPLITGAPGAGDAGAGGYIPGLGTEIIDYTTVGSDGLTSVYQEFLTVFSQYDPAASTLYPATFTVTEPCPCTGGPRNPTSMPSGFVQSAVACHVCGANGGPGTTTMTVPCSTGPYATQAPMTGSGTPASGPAPTGAAAAGSASGSGSGTGAGSAAGAGTGSGGGSGNVSGAAAGSTAGSGSGSGSGPVAGTAASSGAGTVSGPAAGTATGSSAVAAASAGSSGVAISTAADIGAAMPTASSMPSAMGGNYSSIMPPISPAGPAGSAGSPASGNTAGSNTGSSSTATYTGSADRVKLALSFVIAGAVGSLALML